MLTSRSSITSDKQLTTNAERSTRQTVNRIPDTTARNPNQADIPDTDVIEPNKRNSGKPVQRVKHNNTICM